MSPEGSYLDTKKGWCLHSDTVRIRDGWVAVMGDGAETPLSAVRLSGMEVPPREALDMNGSPHLTIGYLSNGSVGTWGAELDG